MSILDKVLEEETRDFDSFRKNLTRKDLDAFFIIPKKKPGMYLLVGTETAKFLEKNYKEFWNEENN